MKKLSIEQKQDIDRMNRNGRIFSVKIKNNRVSIPCSTIAGQMISNSPGFGDFTKFKNDDQNWVSRHKYKTPDTAYPVATCNICQGQIDWIWDMNDRPLEKM